MDVNLDQELIDYLIFCSGSLDKIGRSNSMMIEYEKINTIIDQEDDDEPHPATNTGPDADYSEDYANEFDDTQKEKIDTQPKTTEEQEGEGENEGEGFGGQAEDDEIIRIAEGCLIKIAEQLLDKKVTIRELFEGEIISEEIEGQKIELLLPLSFLEGLKKLEINEFDQVEIGCLMNVLAKPQLENTIILDELIDIMTGWGVPEYFNEEEGFGAGDQESDNKHTPQETPEPVNDQQTKKSKGKRKDIHSVSDDAKELMLNFLMFLEAESMTCANFFEAVKYEQMVKTKKGNSKVDIVPSEDFFRLIESTYEIISDVNLTENVRSELKSVFWLDSTYKDLFYMKNIDKALKEIKNMA